MNRIFGIALLALAFTQAAAQTPAAEELPQALATAIDKSEALAGGRQVDVTQEVYETLDIDYQSMGLLRRFVAPLRLGRATHAGQEPYRLAFINVLRSKDPKVRGLASLVAGHSFDLELLPHLGALLDDDEPTLAVPGGMPQQAAASRDGNGDRRMVRPTVQILARQAVERMIGLSFTSKADFSRWASRSQPVQTKLWYWSSKWRHRAEDDTQVAGSRILPFPPPIDEEFESLPFGAALNLLAWRAGGLQDELSADLSLSPDLKSDSRAREIDFWFWPKSEEIAAYVNRHKLNARMMAALEDHELTGIQATEPKLGLARMAAGLGRWVFGPKDDARLARIQAMQADADIAEKIAIARSYLTPAKGANVLAAYVSSVSDANDAARELVSRFGSQAGEALFAYFQKADGWYRTMITDELRQAARRRVPVSTEFLLKLVRAPDATKERLQDNSLANIAETANLVLGREAVGPLEIEAARYKGGKMSQADSEAANAGRPAALARLRVLLEEVLKGNG